MGTGFLFWGDKNVLELIRGGGGTYTANLLNVTEFCVIRILPQLKKERLGCYSKLPTCSRGPASGWGLPQASSPASGHLTLQRL